MLNELSIKNIVLVDNLKVDFNDGLSSITGETGAGKSILLDALGLACGMRSSSKLIRHGEKKATIIATFKISKNHIANDFLNNNDIEIYDLIILKRIITSDSKSKCYINDTPCTVSILKQIGDMLIDVQGQFDQHGLLNPKNHMKLLDDFSNNKEITSKTKENWKKYKENLKEFEILKEKIKKEKEDSEYILYSLKELKDLDVKENEENKLLEKKKKLQDMDNILANYNSILVNLEGDNGIENSLRKSDKTLYSLSKNSSNENNKLESKIHKTIELTQEIKEILYEKINEFSNFESKHLEEIDDRIHVIKDIARKHRVTTIELPNILKKFEDKASLITSSDKEIEKAEIKLNKVRKEYIEIAEKLSQSRKKSALFLTDKVNNELPDLKLANSKFIIEIKNNEPENWGSNGKDKIDFLTISNIGQSKSPMHKSLSGGELSRLLLALNLAFSNEKHEKVMVFDEVDSGVGGETAHAIGLRLKKLTDNDQVIVITHSPQVSAICDNHIFVEKYNKDNNTFTSIKTLSNKESTEEIARMISGDNISKEAIKAANKMRKDAQEN